MKHKFENLPTNHINFHLFTHLSRAQLPLELSKRIQQCFRHGIEHQERPYLLQYILNWADTQIQNSVEIFAYDSKQNGSFMETSLDGRDFFQLHRLSRQSLSSWIIDAVHQDVDQFCREREAELEGFSPQIQFLRRQVVENRENMVMLLEVGSFVNQVSGIPQYYSQLVPLVYRLIQMYRQENLQINFNACKLFLFSFTSSLAHVQSSKYRAISKESTNTLFMKALLSVSQELRTKLLSLNAEFILLNDILGCFSDLLHWEAWARVFDFLLGHWWYSGGSALPLIAIAISILVGNTRAIMEARSREELQAHLKIYGRVTVNIEELLERADIICFEQIQPLAQPQQEHNEQLESTYNFMKGRGFTLSHIHKMIRDQRLPQDIRTTQFEIYEDFELEVPEEHENSIIRDQVVTNSFATNGNILTSINQESNVPKIVRKPVFSMIYMLVSIVTSDPTEVISVHYAGTSQQLSSSFIQLPYAGGEYTVRVSVSAKKQLRSFVVDIRGYKPDTVCQSGIEFVEEGDTYERQSFRSVAQVTVLVTTSIPFLPESKEEQETAIGENDYTCLQQSLYQSNESVVKLMNLGPTYWKSLNNQELIGLEAIQWFAYMAPTWKSKSICSYQTFKKLILVNFNVDSTQFALQQLSRFHSYKQNIFLMDFLINMVVLLPGSFQQKCMTFYDLMVLFQPTAFAPQIGLQQDVAQAFVLQLYRTLHAPINYVLEDSCVLRATISPHYLQSDIASTEEVDFTTQLKLIQVIKCQKYFNQDLLFVDSNSTLFILQQILLPTQILQIKNMRAEALIVYIKVRYGDKVKKLFYQINQQFQLLGAWQKSPSNNRSIEQLLLQSERIVQVSSFGTKTSKQVEGILSLEQFSQTLQGCPGLEFLLAGTINETGELLNELVAPKFRLYWGYKLMIEVKLNVEGGVRPQKNYEQAYQNALKSYTQLTTIERTEFEPIKFQLDLNHLVIPMNTFFMMMETELMEKLVSYDQDDFWSEGNISQCSDMSEVSGYGQRQGHRPNLIDFENMDRNLCIQNDEVYDVLSGFESRNLCDLIQMNHFELFHVNYSNKREQEHQMQVQYPHLAYVDYTGGVRQLKSCMLEGFTRGKDGSTKFIAVRFQQSPQILSFLKYDDVVFSFPIDENEYVNIEKPWRV